MQSKEVRQKFIDYYKNLGHSQIDNMPLVLPNDSSTLFNSSGMQALVPYLLGEPHPLGKRLVNVQKSLRTQDLDEIGDGHHHSFFEMLGCWSLGDYFKKEQIAWTLDFFVEELGIPAEKLYVSVFAGDESAEQDTEAVESWKKAFAKYNIVAEDSQDITKVGEGKYRIFYYGKEGNWWERSPAPIGDPAGPDTEIFYFTGTPHNTKFGEHCHLNCNCGRFIEIGNDVFMQYKKIAEEVYEQLPSKNVDVGWGLERIVSVVQQVSSTYETDLFLPTIKKLEELSGLKFMTNSQDDWVFRIVSDHLRAACFLIADGVLPSNKLQGYVLRRLLRRVIFQTQKLKLEPGSLATLAQIIVQTYEEPYPHLKKSQTLIESAIAQEEEKFLKTLKKGLQELDKLAQRNTQTLNSEHVQLLYESYGIPKELTVEICKEKGYFLTQTAPIL